MKQLEVHIMGEGYVLGCPEGGEARLQQAVVRVDTAMCKIRDSGKVRARDRIAVLAALNLAYDLDNEPVPPAPDSLTEAAPADPQLASLIAQLDGVLGRNGPPV